MAVAQETAPAPPAEARRFTDKTLYGPSGHPRSSDIEQNSLGDCYFVSPLGSLAQQQPQRLENAIKYNADKGTFTVTLYKEESPGIFRDKVTKPVQIEVTQGEIEGNLTRRGGSTVDGRPGQNGPIWPAVMETAYAKMHDRNPKDGLQEGYDKTAHGGWPADALFSLTGVHGKTLDAGDFDDMGMEKAYKTLDTALKENRPVTLATKSEDTHWFRADAPQDGLVDRHAFMVERVYKNESGDVMLQVRNPWGHNQRVGEGHDTPNASISVKLKDIVDGGGLNKIDIGPSPAQQPKLKVASAETGDRHLDSMLASLDDPAAMKQSMRDLAASPDGRQFAASGREQAQQQTQTAAAPQQEEAPAPTRSGPSMRA
ncbi:C2 family cysteine protease [Pseudomonas sp. CGJS7]|uniref:C2 family cysteine protease n=1 Tax=Pseudomonas sp. CGJS7 TaxID=3109348 RepID=UPI00300A15DB